MIELMMGSERQTHGVHFYRDQRPIHAQTISGIGESVSSQVANSFYGFLRLTTISKGG